MTTRDRIIEIASAEIGPGRRQDYWFGVLGYDPGVGKAWCGAFALWCLQQAGLAPGFRWGIDGSGMVGPLKLRRTSTPSRGDIGYLDQPHQHHFLFDYEYDGWIHSVDGNQPDVRQKKRRKGGLAFFSISSLLEQTEQDTQPGPPRYPTVKIGSMGEAVTKLQTELARHGATMVIDGAFGLRTDIAVRDYQTRSGLQPDGVVGPITWGSLLR